MATPSVYTWPAIDTAAVCALQNTAGSGTLVINGTLASLSNPPFTASSATVTFPGISRVVSLTSVNVLNGVNVTITGTYRGAVQTETRAGPNSNTVETTKLFDTVTSVSVDGAVTAMSVGSGSTGQTHWFWYDYNNKNANLGVACKAAATINYSLQVTYDDVNTNASPTVFTPVSTLTAATGSILANTTLPMRFCNIIVNSSSGSGAVTTTIIQQGLKA